MSRHDRFAESRRRDSFNPRTTAKRANRDTRDREPPRSLTARNEKLRLTFAVGLTLLLFFGVLGRLAYLHFMPEETWLARVNENRAYEETFRATRGTIRSHDGKALAMDVACHDVMIDPLYASRFNKSTEEVEQRLTYFLGLSNVEQAKLRTTLTYTNQYAAVKRRVEFQRGNRLKQSMKQKRLAGIIFEDSFRREYPKGRTLSHIIGYANSKGLGYSGIEKIFDGELTGTNGQRVGQLDARRREIFDRRSLDLPAVPGADIYLTIDLVIQEAMENALERAMKEYLTEGAWAVLLDTKTGAVRAMASKPDFDPNDSGVFARRGKELRNQVIESVFEPGSVLKPLSIAAAMDAGFVNRGQHYDCENGTWQHAGFPLRDAGRTSMKWLSIDEVLMKSSNIGTAKAVLRLGKMMNGTHNMRLGGQRLYEYYDQFGLINRTGLELPSESILPLGKPDTWRDVRMSRVAIGQGVAINAMQLAAGINAIANDGVFVSPHLVHKIVDTEGKRVGPDTAKRERRRVVKAAVAKDMREMMRRVVMGDKKDCTGHRARVDGYQTAGKTGTAQKVINGRYSSVKNIASFVGFVPADEPVFTLVVVLDEPKDIRNPRGRQLGGGTSAALVFREIAEKAADKLSVPMRDAHTHASAYQWGAPLGGNDQVANAEDDEIIVLESAEFSASVRPAPSVPVQSATRWQTVTLRSPPVGNPPNTGSAAPRPPVGVDGSAAPLLPVLERPPVSEKPPRPMSYAEWRMLSANSGGEEDVR